MGINIRQIEPKDNRILAEIIRSTFREHDAPQKGTVYYDPTTDNLYQLFQIPRSILWVAEKDDLIVGCCGIYPTEGLSDNCVELVKFYLSKAARGEGIGKELMEKSIQSAREFGYTQIYLESLPQFSRAVRIYENQGFVRLNKPLGSSGHRTCDIWMLKELI